MTNARIGLLLLLTFIGCGNSVWPDLPWDEFRTPVSVGDIELSQLNLADDDVTYFEIRDAFEGYEGNCVVYVSVRSAIGEKCSGVADPEACIAEFEGMTLNGIPRCTENIAGLLDSPIYSLPRTPPLFTLLAINHGARNDSLEYSTETFAGFLGPIDTEAEASVFLWNEHYYWDSEEIHGIRPVNDGYEFTTTRQTRSCDPVEYSRVLLHLHANGEIEELRSMVIRREDACWYY